MWTLVGEVRDRHGFSPKGRYRLQVERESFTQDGVVIGSRTYHADFDNEARIVDEVGTRPAMFLATAGVYTISSEPEGLFETFSFPSPADGEVVEFADVYAQYKGVPSEAVIERLRDEVIAGVSPESIGAASDSHADSHAEGGSDAVTPADIGAQPALSGSIPYVTQSGQRTSASYTAGTFPGMFAFVLSDQSIGLENVHSKVNDLLTNSGIQTLTNPTTIPVDGPSRLDLVFTEPTTVTFEQPAAPADPGVMSPTPGLTDIVLSIEGYEHVTWSGVVIHGTPDQSGVVWASALWRQRNSSWHLLCEQDASQGGGTERVTNPVDRTSMNVSMNFDPDTGVYTYPTDGEGYSIPVEEPEDSLWVNGDHVVRWTVDNGNHLLHHTQPVLTGEREAGGVLYSRVKGWTGGPKTGDFTDGIMLSMNVISQGTRLTAEGTLYMAGDLGVDNHSQTSIASVNALPGAGAEGIGPHIPAITVEDTEAGLGAQLVVNPTPGADGGISIFTVIGSLASGERAIAPPNPDGGPWEFPFKATFDRRQQQPVRENL